MFVCIAKNVPFLGRKVHDTELMELKAQLDNVLSNAYEHDLDTVTVSVELLETCRHWLDVER